MKAAICTKYGPPEVIQITDVDKPTPSHNEVLLKVRAASVNPLDGGLMVGQPYTFRLFTGLRAPKNTRIGVDVAGQVEAIGTSVTQFQPGDEVFGVCIRDAQASGVGVWINQGGFAEYACAPEAALTVKPPNVRFEQAASVPLAALTALQGLRDKGKVQPEQRVLINGAAGGVGTFAVQIAKSLGAEVAGVCSSGNVEMVRSLGAERVFDYAKEDFTASGQHYDVVFDCIGNHSLSACRRVLARKGIYLGVGGPGSRWLLGLMGRPLAILVMSLLVSQRMAMFLALPRNEDLNFLRDLLASGKVTPVIDRCYKLSEVAEAIRYQQQHHARGKVVITMD